MQLSKSIQSIAPSFEASRSIPSTALTPYPHSPNVSSDVVVDIQATPHPEPLRPDMISNALIKKQYWRPAAACLIAGEALAFGVGLGVGLPLLRWYPENWCKHHLQDLGMSQQQCMDGLRQQGLSYVDQLCNVSRPDQCFEYEGGNAPVFAAVFTPLVAILSLGLAVMVGKGYHVVAKDRLEAHWYQSKIESREQKPSDRPA